GRVVDDDIDAGRFLERADVTAFFADDAALHVIGGEIDRRDGVLGDAFVGEALNGVEDNLAGVAVGVLFGAIDGAGGQLGDLRGDIALDALHQQGLGLIGGELRDRLELPALLVDQLGHLRVLAFGLFELLLAALFDFGEVLILAGEILFAAFQ